MKNYLVSWKDSKGYFHNGSFTAKNVTELREQFVSCVVGKATITDIQIL